MGLIKDLNQTKNSSINACESAAEAVLQSALDNFRTVEWPVPFTANVCGDGLVFDTEDCDDGTGGVPAETATCNINCTTSVCGDGILNVTDGEQCDDGNVEALDGCNATCQTE